MPERIKRGIRVFILFFLLPVFPTDGQEKPYQIGPNDVLSIVIYAGGEKQHESDLTVSVSGKINAPFIGDFNTKGLTTDQLQKEIKKILARDYFVNPSVVIRIKEYNSLHYYISGAVRKPGLYKTTTDASLLELIAKAEGALPERGNIAYIMRHASGASENTTADPIKVDLVRLLDKGDMNANPILQPGDVVYIPTKESFNIAESKIYVDGEVRSPGIYEYQEGMTALSACIRAGGFSRFAAPNRAQVVRQKADEVEVIKINLDSVVKGKVPDVKLQPGDRIHIPESWL